MTTTFQIEQLDERIKITLPVDRNRGLTLLFSAALIVWLVMLVVVLIYLIGGTGSSLVLAAILVIWLIVWLFFGRFLWKRWQYFAATREILFIDEPHIILRRPVSILGQTTTYERQHVSAFYISDRHHCPAFDYAYLHVYFGQSLEREDAKKLVGELNRMLFGQELAADD